tara:strand:+ start:121 stop:342 length:222 start_codon:yes stop_codon:yes gene_type:complete
LDNNKDRFKILAEKRTNKVLKDIKLIGNLANKSNYSYSQAEASKIHNAIKKALDTMKARFDAGGEADDDEFKL